MSHYPTQSQQSYGQGTLDEPRPFAVALFTFPWQILKVWTMPSSSRFKSEAPHANWGLVWLYLLGLTILTGLLAFLYGHTPMLSTSTTRPLVGGVAFGITLAVPGIFFMNAGIMHLMARHYHGQGTFLALCYTSLLTAVPFVIIADILALLLLLNPALHSLSLLLLLALLVYTLILTGLAVVGIHEVSGGEATTIVLVPLVSILALLVLLILLFIAEDFSLFESGSSSSSGSSGNRNSSNNSSSGSGSSSNSSGGQASGALANDVFYTSGQRYYPRYYSHSTGPGNAGSAPVGDSYNTIVQVQCPVCHQINSVPRVQASIGVPCSNCAVRMEPLPPTS